MPISDWKDISSIFASIFTALGILFAVIKTIQELKRFREQRALEIEGKTADLRQKRTEFFIDQHRRLFDDKDLNSVLCLLDSDDQKMTEEPMLEPKRKFLAFFEEIALLIRSEYLDREVALYMFGYYALCAKNGKNFWFGIDNDRKYWGLFYELADNYEIYKNSQPNGPKKEMVL